MASVEQIKEFEAAIKAEAEARIELDDKLESLKKAQGTVAKLLIQAGNLESVWNEAERTKSRLFDQILAVQNL
jgi:hypothetical protein